MICSNHSLTGIAPGHLRPWSCARLQEDEKDGDRQERKNSVESHRLICDGRSGNQLCEHSDCNALSSVDKHRKETQQAGCVHGNAVDVVVDTVARTVARPVICFDSIRNGVSTAVPVVSGASIVNPIHPIVQLDGNMFNRDKMPVATCSTENFNNGFKETKAWNATHRDGLWKTPHLHTEVLDGQSQNIQPSLCHWGNGGQNDRSKQHNADNFVVGESTRYCARPQLRGDGITDRKGDVSTQACKCSAGTHISDISTVDVANLRDLTDLADADLTNTLANTENREDSEQTHQQQRILQEGGPMGKAVNAVNPMVCEALRLYKQHAEPTVNVLYTVASVRAEVLQITRSSTANTCEFARSVQTAIHAGAQTMVPAGLMFTLMHVDILKNGSRRAGGGRSPSRAVSPDRRHIRQQNRSRKFAESTLAKVSDGAIYGTTVVDIIRAVNSYGVPTGACINSISNELRNQEFRVNALRHEEREMLTKGMTGAPIHSEQRHHFQMMSQMGSNGNLTWIRRQASVAAASAGGAGLHKCGVGLCSTIVLFFSAIIDGLAHARLADLLGAEGIFRGGVLSSAVELLMACAYEGTACHRHSSTSQLPMQMQTVGAYCVAAEMRALVRGIKALAAPEMRQALRTHFDKHTTDAMDSQRAKGELGLRLSQMIRAELAAFCAAAWPSATSLSDLSDINALIHSDIPPIQVGDSVAVQLGIREGCDVLTDCIPLSNLSNLTVRVATGSEILQFDGRHAFGSILVRPSTMSVSSSEYCSDGCSTISSITGLSSNHSKRSYHSCASSAGSVLSGWSGHSHSRSETSDTAKRMRVASIE